eukprot:scpid45783/ scgid11400/ 
MGQNGKLLLAVAVLVNWSGSLPALASPVRWDNDYELGGLENSYPEVCCRCSVDSDEGKALAEDLFLFYNASRCNLTCCQNWNSSFTSVTEEDRAVCSSSHSGSAAAPAHKTAFCSGWANCSCNTLSYPDRVNCCANFSPTCTFLQAYYPTRPQGLCVRNHTEFQLGEEGQADISANDQNVVGGEHHLEKVQECPGCSSNPSEAVCELMHGCCVCCSKPNPCVNGSSVVPEIVV